MTAIDVHNALCVITHKCVITHLVLGLETMPFLRRVDLAMLHRSKAQRLASFCLVGIQNFRSGSGLLNLPHSPLLFANQ
jgi:hypothetical protein